MGTVLPFPATATGGRESPNQVQIGFSRVELLPPPADAYEQLRYGKRVMVAGYKE